MEGTIVSRLTPPLPVAHPLAGTLLKVVGEPVQPAELKTDTAKVGLVAAVALVRLTRALREEFEKLVQTGAPGRPATSCCKGKAVLGL